MRRMTFNYQIGIAARAPLTGKEWFQSANFQRRTYREGCPTDGRKSEACARWRQSSGVQGVPFLVISAAMRPESAVFVHEVVLVLTLFEPTKLTGKRNNGCVVGLIWVRCDRSACSGAFSCHQDFKDGCTVSLTTPWAGASAQASLPRLTAHGLGAR